ncbi:hypothetical protein [Aeromicrobium sp.]|uniref:hypothetical protein n=1 Tax=Aeromicrobium sp. TaxID=1871063 RepID=UPI00198C9E85|nr:hypothetical protein [Aeromicrobium sp.]MBC7633262.1 hypothetical protein [Aeromicrobium sp.]
MGDIRIQHARRTNPYPWTWEIPAAIATTVVLLAGLVLHAARTIANLFAGAGFELTPRVALFSSIPGIVGGDAATGLTSRSATYASSEQLWTWIIGTELGCLVGVALAVRWGMARWGPGRIQGMAPPREAETLLGLSRLRRNAQMIRPDLHSNATFLRRAKHP